MVNRCHSLVDRHDVTRTRGWLLVFLRSATCAWFYRRDSLSCLIENCLQLASRSMESSCSFIWPVRGASRFDNWFTLNIVFDLCIELAADVCHSGKFRHHMGILLGVSLPQAS